MALTAFYIIDVHITYGQRSAGDCQSADALK